MRSRLLAGTAIAVLLAGLGVQWVVAQDAPAADTPDAAVAEEAAAEAPNAAVTEEAAAETADDEGLLGEDELDELVAPIALYPDALLTQVLVAATYPIDIVKADRFLTSNKDLSDKDRQAQAETQDWDASVQSLTGGFPTVVQRMATEIDWTENLGDAMLAQSDDVLDAVQRQRARAAAVGNLATNDAQVVEQTDDNISIAPADPDVVYVPQYDTTTAFTTPYTAPPVINTGYGYGYTTGNLITTGAIAFGTALLVDEIFDDDDDWDDYWHGDGHIDWDEDDIHPRADVDIEDVNIDRSVNVDRDRNTLAVDRGDRTNIDRGDRTNIDRNRIGDVDANRETWKPSAQKQAAARDRLASRERPERAGAAAAAGGAAAGGAAAAAAGKLKAGGGSGKISRSDVGERANRPGGQGRPAARPSTADIGAGLADRGKGGNRGGTGKGNISAFGGNHGDAGKANKALARGDRSVNKASTKKAVSSRPKTVSRAKSVKAPKKVAPPRKSAFKQSGGGRASAAKARGSRSSAGGGRGGGGRGGGGGGRRR